MISRRLYKLIYYGALIGSFLGVVPATFDPKLQKGIPSATGLKRLRRNTALFAFWNLFTVGQLVRFYVSKQFQSFNIVLLYAFPCFLILQLFFLFSFRDHECIEAFNDVIFFAKYVNKNFLLNYNPDRNKFSLFVDVAVFSTIAGIACVYPLNCLQIIFYPKQENFVANILPETCPFLLDFYVSYVLPIHIISILYPITAVFSGLVLLYGLLVVPFVILEFPVNKSKSYHSSDKLRRPPTLYNAWRTVQILQSKINNCLGFLLVPSQTLCLKLGIICAYMLMKQSEGLKTSVKVMLYMWGFSFTAFWCFVLLMGGYMDLYGQKILKSWKLHNWSEISLRERKILKKFVKSCQPFRLSYGNTYVIKRLSVLKYMRQLIRGIFRALVTLGKKSQ